jgi:phage host-nuclease inhibitor protein Gam
MPKRITRKITAVPTRDQMEVLVADIRHLKIGLLKLNAERESLIKQIDDRLGPKMSSLTELIEEKSAEIQLWAEANPRDFEKRKSLELTHGTIGFRTGTPKLALLSRAWNWAKALAEVQMRLPNFVRSSPEIDKEALIAQRHDQAIQITLPKCGLQVTQDEGFFIEPKIDEVELTQKQAA